MYIIIGSLSDKTFFKDDICVTNGSFLEGKLIDNLEHSRIIYGKVFFKIAEADFYTSRDEDEDGNTLILHDSLV